MSRSSEFYKRVNESRKRKRDMKVLKFNESEDFLDFNQFGPGAGAVDVEDVTMTLDEFVNLPVFSTGNCQKAVLALQNNEEITLEHDDDTVTMSSSDNETVHIQYGDITLDFVKDDLLKALQEIIDVSINEKLEIEENEMPSVLKFKEFIELEKNTTKGDGKDSF